MAPFAGVSLEADRCAGRLHGNDPATSGAGEARELESPLVPHHGHEAVERDGVKALIMDGGFIIQDVVFLANQVIVVQSKSCCY